MQPTRWTHRRSPLPTRATTPSSIVASTMSRSSLAALTDRLAPSALPSQHESSESKRLVQRDSQGAARADDHVAPVWSNQIGDDQPMTARRRWVPCSVTLR